MAKSLPLVLRPSSTTKSIYLWCFAFVLFQCVVAYPVVPQRAPPWWDPDFACGFEGNSDIYGLGIRLGIYLQWLACLLSKSFLASSNLKILREVLGTNAIFLLSIFIATSLLSTGHVGQVYNVEILLLHHIFFGGAFMVSYDQIRGRARRAPVTFWGVAMLATVATGMAVHAMWFWQSGVYKLAEPGCGGFALVIGKTAVLSSEGRGLYFTAAIINVCLWGAGFLWLSFWVLLPLAHCILTVPAFSISAALDRLRDRIKGNADEPSAKWRDRNQGHGRCVLASIIGILGTPEAELVEKGYWYAKPVDDSPNGPSPGESKPKSRSIFWPILNLLILAYSITAIELIIKWNSIRNVYTIDSTGQVIPLVIGGGILIKTFFAIAAHRLNESAFCPDNESFRLRDHKTWVSFPIHKPERRHSWASKEEKQSYCDLSLHGPCTRLG